MKPLHIVVLVLAGALGGAVVMKVVERPRPSPSPMVAQVQPPAAPSPAPAAEEPKPSPAPEPTPVAPPPPAKPAVAVPARREAPKPRRIASSTPAAANPEPVAAAPTAPPPQPAPAATPAPAPAPQPAPPVRVEPENATPAAPPAAPPEPHKVTLNAGLLIPVRLVDGLSSERNMPGDSFQATLDKELVVDGFVIAERGARVEGRVVASDQGGKVKGVAALAVELTRIRTADGQNVPIRTDSFERHAETTHGQDAAKVGAGAAIGAVIGAIAGGGKGAAVGAGVGGGAGAGDVLLTRGKPVTLPSETRISFRLKAPVTISERRG